MAITRISQSDNSQAARLAKEFPLDAHSMEVFRLGEDRVLRTVSPNATVIFDALAQLPSHFMEAGRDDTLPQERDQVCRTLAKL